MTISTALQISCKGLTLVSDAPHLDAQWLLLHAFGQSEASWLYAHQDQEIPPSVAHVFKSLLAERMSGKPVAYLLGEWEFYGRPFFVNESVLIPRPETEQLVEEALRYIKVLAQDGASFVVVDVGAGSGCIAVTLALELAHIRPLVIATDVSAGALQVAKKNAQRHGVYDSIEFREGDMLAPLSGRHVDLIVSNPPYVQTESLAKAGDAKETKGLLFEPQLALDGGLDGNRFTQQLRDCCVPAVFESADGVVERNAAFLHMNKKRSEVGVR